jgi:hypothetical protein
LLHLSGAPGSLGGTLSAGHGGQQQRDENCDDANDDKKLNERKAAGRSEAEIRRSR